MCIVGEHEWLEIWTCNQEVVMRIAGSSQFGDKCVVTLSKTLHLTMHLLNPGVLNRYQLTSWKRNIDLWVATHHSNTTNWGSLAHSSKKETHTLGFEHNLYENVT